MTSQCVHKKNSRFHGLTGELTRPGILIVVHAGVFARDHHQDARASLKRWPSWQSNARKHVFTKKTMSQVNHPEIFSNWAAQGRILSQSAERLYPSALGSGTSLRRIHHQGYRKGYGSFATMTTDLVDGLGFLPAALSTRNWSTQTQRPLAVAVIGGALAISLLTRVLQPILIYLCHRRWRLAETYQN